MVSRKPQGHHVGVLPADEGTQPPAARFLVWRARVKEQDLMVWTACACVTGAGGQTIFGGRETATFLSKLTTYLAVVFMITSLTLAFLSAGRGGSEQRSALRRAAQRQQQWGTVVPEEQKDLDEIGNIDSIFTISGS